MKCCTGRKHTKGKNIENGNSRRDKVKNDDVECWEQKEFIKRRLTEFWEKLISKGEVYDVHECEREWWKGIWTWWHWKNEVIREIRKVLCGKTWGTVWMEYELRSWNEEDRL